MMQERPRGDGRDSRNGRKCRFGGHRAGRALSAAGVDGSRRRRAGPATRRQQANPERRIAGRGRANQWDAQICGGKARSSDRRSAQRTVVEIPLHEEIRHERALSQEAELPPEPSGDEVEMQPSDSLPFDDPAAAHGVVACAEPPKLDVRAVLGKQLGHPASTFAHVGDDSHRARSVSRPRWTNCSET